MGKKLTPKQDAVIRDVVKNVNQGNKFSVARSVEKIYNVKNKNSAQSIASHNMSKPDFRLALMDALEERKVLGKGGKVEEVLVEGLDAEDKGETDFKTRLDYVKEINKISGVYAPDRKETKTFNLNLNMTKEEAEEKIETLREELADV
jgi:hypothetical protein